MWTPTEIADLIWTQLWQVTVVALLVSLITYLLGARKMHPAISNSLWLLVLVKAVTPPLWASPISLFSWTNTRLSNLALPEFAAGLVDNESRFPYVLLIAFCVWLTGFVAMLVYHIRQWRLLQRSIQHFRLPSDSTLADNVAELCQRLQVRRVPEVVVTSIELGPALMGIWQPVILLPVSLVKQASWREIEPIVAHELIHMKRRDTTVSALQLLASAIWWYHPLVHWAGRQIDEASERCVDLAVIHRTGCKPVDYVRSLMKVLESRCEANHLLLASMPGVRGMSATGQRILELANLPKRPKLIERLFTFACVGLLALVLLPGLPMPSLSPTCQPGFDLSTLEPNDSINPAKIKQTINRKVRR